MVDRNSFLEFKREHDNIIENGKTVSGSISYRLLPKFGFEIQKFDQKSGNILKNKVVTPTGVP
jgi:hypothetical protein